MTSPQSLMILAAFDENIHTEILALVLFPQLLLGRPARHPSHHYHHHHQKSSTRESEL